MFFMADVGVFIVTLIRLRWRRPSSVGIPSILQTIVKNATIYVLLMCTSRVIFVLRTAFSLVCTTLIMQRIVLTFRYLPGRGSHHPVHVRMIHLRELHSCQVG